MLRSLFKLATVLQTTTTTTRSISKQRRTPRVIAATDSLVEIKKKNIPQSPLKMKFLVKLIRGAWVPDALAQLKFTPKHRAVDLTKIINRACALAKLNHNLVPGELMVKEVMVNKGRTTKKMTIMGRGHTGIGYKRESHVTINLARVDFEKHIRKASSVNEAKVWTTRKEAADAAKLELDM